MRFHKFKETLCPKEQRKTEIRLLLILGNSLYLNFNLKCGIKLIFTVGIKSVLTYPENPRTKFDPRYNKVSL